VISLHNYHLKTGDATEVPTRAFQIVKIPISHKTVIWKDSTDVHKTTGYIVAQIVGHYSYFDEEYAQFNGYYIISEDLQDTLATYNLPENMRKFPREFFANKENYRYTYKLVLEYQSTVSNSVVVPAMYPVTFPYAKYIETHAVRPIK